MSRIRFDFAKKKKTIHQHASVMVQMFLGKLEWNSHLQFATLGNFVQNILGSVRENVIAMSFPQLSSPSISLVI